MNTIHLPHRLFLVSAALGLLVPLLARVPGMPWRGWDWLASYSLGYAGLPLVAAFNLIPSLALFALGKASRRAPLAYWLAAAALTGFLLWAHGNLDLKSSSTAVIALFFIPLYALGAVLAGWMLGILLHAITQDGPMRPRLAAATMLLAILAGITSSVSESISVTGRLARFPGTSIAEAHLVKRQVLACCAQGGVQAMALDDFDAAPGRDIAVLGVTGLSLLDPTHYTVKSTSPFLHTGCEHCVHMYPHLAANGRGGLLVATSDGLSDGTGRLLWGTKAEGFSKTVPVHRDSGPASFIAYHTQDRIDLHDADGNVRWSAKLPVQDIGRHLDAEGKEAPYAITCCAEGRKLHLYDARGGQVKVLPLPEWALNVQAIAWPRPGHFLVGGGNLIAVLDPEGREVLKHVIQETSFDPYHGPDGVAVDFRPSDGPHLAVASHGSSGYMRSVLLLFDPKGHLVWQEEVNKLTSLLAVPRVDGSEEVLLTGGMDGVTEYRLPPPPTSQQPRDAHAPAVPESPRR